MKRSSFLLLLSVLTGAPVAQADTPQRFIVQFREPPIALRSTALAAKTYDESLARFRTDFFRIEVAPTSLTGAGARIHREFFRAFHGASVELTRRESIGALSRLPYVARIYPDLDVVAFGSSPKAVERPAIFRPSTAAAAGAGVVVAIIDTGIDYNHPALGGGIGPGRKVIGGYDFANNDADPMDDNGHGTHVAGILAADSPLVTGIAPGVSILAYKILDGTGHGKQSDVIAAIEAALDPNGDGNLADHADVANLSLGSPGGSPDDPVAEAAENAVAAGMIVCAAAGNIGLFHFVSSPAVAPSAIAVGASDAADNLAEFSSRGPATRSGAIKPDVLAPGVGILSLAIGGGTRVLSGTSMSTPYVSGLAAILVADHRAWTPARIKSAIVNTAAPIAFVEVMSQGVGRADRTSAGASSTAIQPTEINFGLDALGQNRWTATRTFTVRNDAAAARTFQVTTSGANPSLAVTVDRATMTLVPGQSVDVAVTIAVDNTTLPDAPSLSFAFSGLVTLASAQETVRVPWAFLKAARALVRYDLEFPSVRWIGNSHPFSGGIVDLKTIEYLLAPGQYDMILTSLSFTNEGRMIVREKQRIEGDVTIAVRQSDASHTISLDARDGGGATFSEVDTPAALYMPQARLIFDTTSGPSSLELPMVRTKTLRVSDVPEKFGLLFSETRIDVATHRIYVAQHELVRGVTGDMVLVKNPGDYR
ncbi:MAG: S8 family serine peptidase, partial [Acidobacteriota bacterium]|nr:S8 family serine peptidase [Acidobacteriota bacterium]